MEKCLIRVFMVEHLRQVLLHSGVEKEAGRRVRMRFHNPVSSKPMFLLVSSLK